MPNSARIIAAERPSALVSKDSIHCSAAIYIISNHNSCLSWQSKSLTDHFRYDRMVLIVLIRNPFDQQAKRTNT